MPKTKRGPSLLEVIKERKLQSESSSLNLPGWWKSRAADAGAGPAGQHSPGRVAGTALGEQVRAAPGQAILDRTSGHATAPLVTIDGPRLVLSFSTFSAGVAATLLIALVVGAFWIGQASGRTRGQAEGFATARESIQAQALNDIELARKSPPRRELFAGMPSSPVEHDSGEAKSVKKRAADSQAVKNQTQQPRGVRGHTYIVVQEFRTEDRAEAEEARRFLQKHKIETTIITSETKSTYKYRLVTRRGFNCDDPLQKKRCNDLHAKIREVGELFVKAGGRYNLQGYQKKVTAGRS